MADDNRRELDWTVHDSRHVVHDRWLTLRADTCETPTGRMIEPYYVLEYPDWVAIVAVTPHDEIVLVRQYRHGLGSVVLELPCGWVEDGESEVSAAARELAEETGYVGREFAELGELSPNPANHSNLMHCFLATGVESAIEPQIDDTESVEIVLTPVDEVLELIEHGEIFGCVHVAALFIALRRLGVVVTRDK